MFTRPIDAWERLRFELIASGYINYSLTDYITFANGIDGFYTHNDVIKTPLLKAQV